MLCLLVSLVLFQEYYYIDCEEFTLRDGTVIQTSEEIHETTLEVSWYEDGTYISIPKRDIDKRRKFSIQVVGRAPKEEIATSVVRRIQGNSAHYEKGGRTYLKKMHVNERGRNIEGHVTRNIVDEIQVVQNSPVAGLLCKVSMLRVDEKRRTELRFFDIKGRRIQTIFIDPAKIKRSKKERKKYTLEHEFRLPPRTELEEIGLVQVISFRK